MLTLQQLITLAPFPEHIKTDIVKKSEEGSLSPQQLFEIEDLAWGLILEQLDSKLTYESQMATANALSGTTTPFDIKKREKELLQEILVSIDSTNTDEQLEEIREKLDTLREQKNS